MSIFFRAASLFPFSPALFLVALVLPLADGYCEAEGDHRYWWTPADGGDNTCFFVFRTTNTYDAQRALCKSVPNSDIATLNSSAKSVAPSSIIDEALVADPTLEFWVGGRAESLGPCLQSNFLCRRDLYLFPDGVTPVTQGFGGRWIAAQPNAVNHPACMKVKNGALDWFDQGCTASRAVVCERAMRELEALGATHTPLIVGSTGSTTVSFELMTGPWTVNGTLVVAFPPELSVGPAVTVATVGDHNLPGTFVVDRVDNRTLEVWRLNGDSAPAPAKEMVGLRFTDVTSSCDAGPVGEFEVNVYNYTAALSAVEGTNITGPTNATNITLPRNATNASTVHIGRGTVTPAGIRLRRITAVSSPSLSVSESGAKATLVLQISDMPTSPVVVTAISSDPTEVAVHGASSVTFTSSDYLTAKTITLTGVPDSTVDGDVAVPITIAVASADADFNNAPGRCIPEPVVTNANVDASGIMLSMGALSITEDGGTAEYTVRLGSIPSGTVNVTVQCVSVGCPLSVAVPSDARLTFPAGNWSVPQTVRLVSQGDDLFDGDAVYTITHTASSDNDTLYDALPPVPLSVTQVDDETEVTIDGISPAAGSTTGGYLVVVTGTGFDQGPVANRSVTVGPADEPCTSPQWISATEVRCIVAPGVGTGHPVNVSVYGGQIMASAPTGGGGGAVTFGYTAPTATAILPQLLLTPGNATITVMGSDFGPPGAPGALPRTVTVGGTDCPAVAWVNHTSVTCTLPAGAGVARAVSVTVASQSGAVAAFYSYASPTVSAVSPAFCPATGAPATVYGTGFGTPGAARVVTFGGTVASGVTYVSHTEVRAIVPAGVGTGSAVVVSVDARPSAPVPGPGPIVVAYNAPRVFAVDPPTAAPGSAATLTITGVNFGTGGALVPASVRVGGTLCGSPVWQADSRVLCTLPPGVGAMRDVIVSVSGQSSALNVTFNYTAPGVTLVDPAEGPANGGYHVTVQGANFGTSSAFGVAAFVGTRGCLNTAWVTDTMLVCDMPAEQPMPFPSAGRPVTVTVGGQVSNADLTFSHREHWTQLDPAIDVAVQGKPIRVLGHGFDAVTAGVQYRCRFNLTGGMIHPGTGSDYVYSDYVTATDSTEIACPLPLWPLPQAVTHVTVETSVLGGSAVLYTGSPGDWPVVFTFAAGWLSVSPPSAIAGLPTMLTITGAAFNTSDTRYTCVFKVGVEDIVSPTSLAVSYDKLLCPVPAGTFDRSGAVDISVLDVDGTSTVPSFGAPGATAFSLTQGVPLAPQVPASTSTPGSFSVSVAWTASTLATSNGALVTSYTLYLDGTAYVTGASLSATIDNLFPTTDYAVTVTALSRIGEGPASAPLVLRTAASPPLLRTLSPQLGPQSGGSEVTITGLQFDTETRVEMASAECVVSFSNATLIVCTAPPAANAGFANVRVRSALGSSASVAPTAAVTVPGNVLAYEYIAAPRVTAAVPPDWPVSGGVAVTMHGSFLGNTAADLLSATLAGVACTSLAYRSEFEAVCTAGPSAAGAVKGPVLARTARGGPSAVAGASLFDYTVPRVDSVTPSSVPTEGGTVLTIRGRYLGTGFDDIARVPLEGAGDCDISDMTWTRTEFEDVVTCAAPAARVLGDVRIRVESHTAGLGEKFAVLTYSRTGFDRLPPFTTAVVPASSNINGGTTVHVYGDNLGDNAGDLVDIRLNGAACFSAAFEGATAAADNGVWLSATHLVCVTAPVRSIGVGVTTVATTLSGRGIGAAKFTYFASRPTVAALRPSHVDPAGAIVVTVRGSDLGKEPPALGNVTVAGVPCIESKWIDDATVTCLAPSLQSLVDTGAISAADTGKGNVPTPVSVTANGLTSEPFASLVYGSPCVPACGWRGTCVAGTCVCDPHWAVPPMCETAAITTEVLTVPGVTSETDADGEGGVSVLFRCNIAPTSPVTVTLSVSDPSEARLVTPGTSKLTFTAGDWTTPQTARVQGIADTLRDGYVPHAVLVTAVESADPNFASMAVAAPVLLNADAPPSIVSVVPEVRPTSGGPVTIMGASFDPVVAVSIDGAQVPAADVRVVVAFKNGTRVVLNMAGGWWNEAARPLFSDDDDEGKALLHTMGQARALDVDTPHLTLLGAFSNLPAIPAGANVTIAAAAMPRNRFAPHPVADPFDGAVASVVVRVRGGGAGYKSIAVRNLDASNGTVPRAFFFTDDCPSPGQFGIGNDCRDCPEGAACPGGFRLRPSQGFWTPSEDSGYVFPCAPAEACLGADPATGRGTCAPGYTKDYCAHCEQTYYRDAAGVCVECPKDGVVALLMLINFLVWLGVTAAGCFIEDVENLGHVTRIVTVIQYTGAIGTMVGTRAPPRVRDMYGFFMIFSGEYHFMKPECRDVVNNKFFAVFFFQLLYSAVIVGALAGSIPIVSLISQKWHSRHGPEIVERRRLFYRARFRRMFTFAMASVYFPITHVALRAFACVKAGDSRVMLVDPAQPCFRDEHRTMIVLGAALFSGLTVGFPVWYNRLLLRNFRRDYGLDPEDDDTGAGRELDPEFAEAWGHLCHPFTPRRWWAHNAWFAGLFIIATGSAARATAAARLGAVGLAVVIGGGVPLVLRAYVKNWEAGLAALALLTNVVAVGFNYVTDPTTGTSDGAISGLAFVLYVLVAVTSAAVVLVMVFFVFVRWQPARSVYGEDYFISKAVHDAFGESAEVANAYLAELENCDEMYASDEEGGDDPVEADGDAASEAPDAAANNNNAGAGRKPRRRVKHRTKDGVDAIDAAIHRMRATKSMREEAGDVEAAGSSRDGGNVLSRAASSLGSFVRPAPPRAGANRYGGPEYPEDDRDIAAGAALGLLGGGGDDNDMDSDNGDGSSDGSAARDAGFGVFFDDKTAMEIMLESWVEENTGFGGGAGSRGPKMSPQLDAQKLSRRKVDVADAESAAVKRVSEITANAVARRIELSIFNLMAGLHYAMCVKEWRPENSADMGVAASIKQGSHISRYNMPWHQTAPDGSPDLSEAVDAIVYETVDKVRRTVLKRLKRGEYAIISDLEVVSISHPTKRILIVNIRA